MDWNEAVRQWTPLRDLIDRAGKVPELERRIIELERKLAAPPCPRCRLPTWHVTKTEPDPVMGDVGAMRRTYHCESCGFEEFKTDV